MGDFNFAGGERVRVNAEAVILCGDFDFLGEQVLDRMIGTVMAEFELEGFAAEGQAADLVTEADAEDGDATEQLFYVFDGIAHGFGIAGAVGEEDAVGAHGENVLGHGGGGNDRDLTLMIDEEAQNVLLDAEIVGDDAEFSSAGTGAGFIHLLGPRSGGQVDGGFLPVVALLAGDAAGELLSGHAGELLGFVDQLIGGGAVGGDDAAERANFANVANEGTGIDVPDGGNFVAIQIELSGFCGTPVGGDLGKFADDERFDVGARRLFIIEIGADIADVRIGEADDLSGVAGVGENFLITGEAGIENDFAAAARDGAGGATVKDAPVFECECSGAVLNFGQWSLLSFSSAPANYFVLASVVESEPK